MKYWVQYNCKALSDSEVTSQTVSKQRRVHHTALHKHSTTHCIDWWCQLFASCLPVVSSHQCTRAYTQTSTMHGLSADTARLVTRTQRRRNSNAVRGAADFESSFCVDPSPRAGDGIRRRHRKWRQLLQMKTRYAVAVTVSFTTTAHLHLIRSE